MKVKFLLAGLFIGLVTATTSAVMPDAVPVVRAQTSASGESITDYAVSLNLEKSGVLHVRENITYNFGDNQKHGIFRMIPLYPVDWPKLDVSVVGVTDPADGSAYMFTTSESSGDLSIKIGNPNVLVNGTKEYVIAYDVAGAVRSFPDHDELYWNVIGSEWAAPIERASADVTLPADISTGTISPYCYTGAAGSQTQGCTVNLDQGGGIAVAVAAPLPPNNGLTVSVSMPKGYIANVVQATPESGASGYVQAETLPINTLISISFFVFIFLLSFVLFIVRVVRGRKKRAVIPKELKHVPIAPYYSAPNGLPPSQIGYTETRIFDAPDFTAIIIDLAIRGFLKIAYLPKEGVFGKEDYELTSLKPYNESLPPEYRSVYDLFFADGATTKRVSAVDRSLGADVLKTTGTAIAKYFNDAGYFVKPKMGGVGGMGDVGTAGFVLLLAASVVFFFQPLVAVVLSMLMIISFGVSAWQHKVRFTPKGIELMRKVLGFKMFLTLTETDRLKLMDAPKTSQGSFEAILPYAIALGVEKEWAKQFESITIRPPQWIDDPRYRTGFNAGIFVASFGSFNSAMRSSTTMPGSGSGAGGGGGVGGGGGGGGGGSW